MSVILKQLIGKAGAGLDESHSFDNLHAVLAALATDLNDLIAQFNQLRTDYNAETNADHADTGATAVTPSVTIE